MDEQVQALLREAQSNGINDLMAAELLDAYQEIHGELQRHDVYRLLIDYFGDGSPSNRDGFYQDGAVNADVYGGLCIHLKQHSFWETIGPNSGPIDIRISKPTGKFLCRISFRQWNTNTGQPVPRWDIYNDYQITPTGYIALDSRIKLANITDVPWVVELPNKVFNSKEDFLKETKIPTLYRRQILSVYNTKIGVAKSWFRKHKEFLQKLHQCILEESYLAAQEKIQVTLEAHQDALQLRNQAVLGLFGAEA